LVKPSLLIGGERMLAALEAREACGGNAGCDGEDVKRDTGAKPPKAVVG
jgi:hypothetical protein